jgi:hypothetical protein
MAADNSENSIDIDVRMTINDGSISANSKLYRHCPVNNDGERQHITKNSAVMGIQCVFTTIRSSGYIA